MSTFPQALRPGPAPGRGHTRLRIVHRTVVDYDGAVRASYNELRMTPMTGMGQTALEARIDVAPRVGVYRYLDYFGTHVVAFDIHTSHERLELVATSVVEVDPPAPPWAHETTWEYLRAPHRMDRNVEWLVDRPMTEAPEELAGMARDRAADLSPHEAAVAISGLVHERMSYVPGATGVHTIATQAWEEGRGVCQDFAHLALGALRSVGIPCRYVSGYLHPHPQAPIGRTVAGQSHAWVEWWVGEWVAFDPTNNALASSDHVIVAQGRDYSDVPPLRGVYSGPAGSEMRVTVEITRLR